MHEAQKEVLKGLLKQGVNIAISSRVVAGMVAISKKDLALGFIDTNGLNPQKARILLALALTKTNEAKKIQEYFLKY